MAIAFDENGRLFVAEGSGLNGRGGRIRVLEDKDGDGVFDSNTIFAENVGGPTALACYGGGVFVGTAREIIYMKNAQPDSRQVVFSGFGNATNIADSGLALNNFNWGIDSRIHVGAAGLAGTIAALAGGGGPVVLGRNDFAFDPRALTIAPESGSAQSGLSFDTRGRRFVTGFVHPLSLPLLGVTANPFAAVPSEPLEIATDAEPIFRFGVPPPAPLPGNRSSVRPAPTNGLVQAWFTQARGAVVYRGIATNYLDHIFIADSDAHIIHHVILHERGLEVIGARAPDEQRMEFVLSTDAAFNPIQIVNAPDGALYIADLHGGGDHGRIFRLVPDNFKQPKPPELGKATTYQLAAALAHPFGWYRDTAARLLFERRDPAAIPLLTNMVNNSHLATARLHALCALDGLDALTEPALVKGLRDPDARVRERAVMLCAKRAAAGALPPSAWNQLAAMVNDPAVPVRYQLVLALGPVRGLQRDQMLGSILANTPDDPWFQAAIMSGLSEGAGDVLVTVASQPSFRANTNGLRFLEKLATMIGTQGRQDDVTQVIEFIDKTQPDALTCYSVLASLGDGLRLTDSSLPLVDSQNRLTRFYDAALEMSVKQENLIPQRVAAIRLRGESPASLSESGEWLQLLLSSGQPPEVEIAAIHALGRYEDPTALTNVFSRFANFPILRQEAATELIRRAARWGILLDAIETSLLARRDLNSVQMDLLRTSDNAEVRDRAIRLFGPSANQLPDVVARFAPSLGLKGRGDAGRELFVQRCARCHRLAGEGQKFGPDLTPLRTLSKPQVLSSILQPGADIAPNHATSVCLIKGGDVFAGILRNENPTTITLLQPRGEAVVIPRANVGYLESKPWSLMPAGLEEGLAQQDMADLLEFVMTATPPPR
jgi:putative membrane-bound dehydrogenase-like protein